jgi:alpha-L-fucosidase 2
MRDSIIMKTPASWHRDMYREGAPTGNGTIGALVYGGIAKETIVINHNRLWSPGKKMELPDIKDTLEQTRSLIDEGRYMEANWISANALREKDYAPKLQTPCSVMDINLLLKDRTPFKQYRRIVHMDTGEVTVKWLEGNNSFHRNLFVSRKNDTIFYEINSSGCTMDLDIWLDFHETFEEDGKKKRAALEDKGEIASYAKENYVGFYAKHEDDTYYGGVGFVNTDGSVLQEENKITISKAEKVVLAVKIFIKEDKEMAVDAKKLLPVGLYDYQQELKQHKSLHEPFYKSANLILSDKTDSANEELLARAYDDLSESELIEKQWRFGRYLMICGTGKEGLPFPLYGLWHGRYSMPWPHNMANENVQMIYWHTLSGGLEFAPKTLIHYYTERMDNFRECARKVFGLPGIYLPAGTTPDNSMPNQIVPVIMNWVGCAGWLSQHFYHYYLYTGDEETLTKEILPFMTEAALFYENYLVKEKDGAYKIYPSVSPENTPKNLIPGGNEDLAHPCPSVVNATMDVAIIKELLTNLLAITRERGIYKEKQELWENIIRNLPVYETTDKGDMKEWLYEGLEQRYNHRHLSHIYPVFPGMEAVKGRDSDELLNSFKLAVDKRILGAQTGWSLAHMACIYARFMEADKAMECLDILNKSCLLNNLFTLHNDWRGMGLTLGRGSFAPVQLDACMGVVGAVQEMLMYSGTDFLKLLPALPKRLGQGSVEGLRFMQGVLSMEWDMDKDMFTVTIKVVRDTNILLYLPPFIVENYPDREKSLKVMLKAGEEKQIAYK